MQTPIEIIKTRSPRPRPPEHDLGFGRYFTDHMLLMDFHPDKGWHAGRVVPYGPIQMDPAAAALHYGQTIFEGMKAFPDQQRRVRFFRMMEHLNRLNESAKMVCIPIIDPAYLAEGLQALLAVDGDWMPKPEGTSLYLRPVVYATEGFLGVRPSKLYQACVLLSPVGNYYAAGVNPVRIWVEQKATRAAPGGLGMAKTGANYAASLRAAEEAKARGYAQVLWLDAKEHKYVEEVGTMNLFVRIGDEVITPPLEGGTLLAGMTRSTVLAVLREQGVKVTERRLSIDEIKAAHANGTLAEVFGTGTAAVISPVGELGFDNGSLKISDTVGPVASRLRQTISDIQYGRVPDTHGWMTPVRQLESAA